MPEFITLAKAMKTEEVEQGLLDEIGSIAFETQRFEIRTIDPVMFVSVERSYIRDFGSIMDLYKEEAEPWQRRLVAKYRKQIRNPKSKIRQRFLIVDDDALRDGHHRLIAYALEGVRAAKAVDLNRPEK